MYSKTFIILSAVLFSSLSCTVYVTIAQSCGTLYRKAEIHLTSHLTSPNYPHTYNSSTTCVWNITAPFGYVVELRFATFDLGLFSGGSCGWFGDKLEIRDDNYLGKLHGIYCGHYQPANVYSSGTSLYLKLTSSFIHSERKGFDIEYKAVIPKPNSSICSPFNTYLQNNHIQRSGSSGYITSPLYGAKYPRNMQCTWIITVPKGKKIKLTFSYFIFEGSFFMDCDVLDHLQIKDGEFSFSPILKTLCGTRLPSPVYSSGRYLWIQFNSNDNYNDNRSTNGFKAKYEAITPHSFSENDNSADSEEPEFNGDLIAGIIIPAFLFAVCICVCIIHNKRKRRPPDQALTRTQGTTAQEGTGQSSLGATSQYQQQTRGGIVSPPPVGYSSVPQCSYPPSGSNPMSTYDGTSQPSEPMNDHPSSTLLNDPPPAYSEVFPGVSPPPYPGISPHPSHMPTTQNQATPHYETHIN